MGNNTTTDGIIFRHINDLDELKPLTEKIIGCAYKVSNTLGKEKPQMDTDKEIKKSVIICVDLWSYIRYWEMNV